MSKSTEVPMITVSKQNAGFIFENLRTAGSRNLLSRAEVNAGQAALNKLLADRKEEDEEYTVEKEALRDLLELLEHCTQRNPPFSKWDLKNIQTVLVQYKDQM